MNTRWTAICLTVIFGLILQATIFREINLFGLNLVPDFVLILVVTYGLLKGPWFGAVLGLTSGLLADLAGGGLIGVGALAKMATGFLAGLLEKTIFKDNLLVPLISLFAGTLVSSGLFLAVSSALGWSHGNFFLLLPKLFAMALYNAILAPLIYRQFYRLETRLASG